MFSPDDTIVALATPPGRGGLAVVRLSGPRAREIASALIADDVHLEARRATLVRVVAMDEAIATWFAAPASYTGEDVVEFSVHGSPVVAGEVIAAATVAGARLARAGEFTLRAFLNGRLDLTRAEAVQDLVASTTPVQARMAFDQLQGRLAGRIGEIEQSLFDLTARLEASGDFPDEGHLFISPGEAAAGIRAARARVDALLRDAGRGTLLREGATVAIVGRPNVGKSTLFNRLAGVDRAIVTEVPGTTRDVLIEAVSLGGAMITIVDTAGLRATTDPVEREGVARAERAGATATLALVVLDLSAAITEDDERVLEATSGRPRVIVGTKSDLPRAWALEERGRVAGRTGRGEAEDGCREPEPGHISCGPGPAVPDAVAVSAITGGGIDELVRAIARNIGVCETLEPAIVSNIRHIELLKRAAVALARAEALAEGGLGHMPEELLLADLALAREALEEVTGKRSSDDLLDAIFSRFCIGK